MQPTLNDGTMKYEIQNNDSLKVKKKNKKKNKIIKIIDNGSGNWF